MKFEICIKIFILDSYDYNTNTAILKNYNVNWIYKCFNSILSISKIESVNQKLQIFII